ncbi:putative peptidoglycan binding protein [Aliiruegeria haliotis]|uniref:Putative peptidoglycan binding protein n=1 Tax=Aliiruegeria haliotis TaxID=1280846 RepID=A0A2T0RR71_9RHOB|nr:peptidoglycan-binding domain-containing protein [Aliiruegeria haliotis]PRY23684.1 putative peptidoglycan binding protein [Aliiruegeria haliotis]
MKRIAFLAVCLALAACGTSDNAPAVARILEAEPIAARDASGPPDAAPGTCWGRDETPATLETVTERVLVSPERRAADGTVEAEAVYSEETRQRIVEERSEVWFETPCPDRLTPDVIASLQRALRVRGYYGGEVTGELTAETRSAIRRFQQPQGLNSAILSLKAARQLGLVAIDLSRPDDTASG